jgi:hypothetical protein
MSAPLHPQTQAELSALMLKLAGNPATRRRLLGMVKEIDPKYRAPADVQLEEFKEQSKREQAEARAKWEQQQLQRARTNQRQQLIASGKYDEEQVKDIEASVLKKYPTLDYEAAAKLYASDSSPARQRAAQRPSKHWELPWLEGLMDDPAKAANDTAYAMIDEFRGR